MSQLAGRDNFRTVSPAPATLQDDSESEWMTSQSTDFELAHVMSAAGPAVESSDDGGHRRNTDTQGSSQSHARSRKLKKSRSSGSRSSRMRGVTEHEGVPESRASTPRTATPRPAHETEASAGASAGKENVINTINRMLDKKLTDIKTEEAAQRNAVAPPVSGWKEVVASPVSDGEVGGKKHKHSSGRNSPVVSAEVTPRRGKHAREGASPARSDSAAGVGATAAPAAATAASPTADPAATGASSGAAATSPAGAGNASAAGLIGSWDGTFWDGSAPDKKYGVKIVLALPEGMKEGKASDLRGNYDSPDMKINGMPVDKVTLTEDGAITFEVSFKAFGIGVCPYEGRVKDGKMEGSYNFMGRKGAFLLERRSAAPPLVVTTDGMLRKVLRFNARDWWLALIGCLSAVVVGGAPMLFFRVLGDVISAFASPDVKEIVSQKAVLMVVIMLAMTLASFLQSYALELVGSRFARRLRIGVFASLTRQEISFFDANNSAELGSRLTGDVQITQAAYTNQIGLGFQNLALTLFGFVIAFTNSWKLTLVNMCMFPLIIAFGIIKDKVVSKRVTAISDLTGQASAVVEEVLSGLRTVRAFGGEPQEIKRYTTINNNVYSNESVKAALTGLGLAMLQFSVYGGYTLGFWYGSVLVQAGEVQGGQVLTVFFTVIFAAFGLVQMFSVKAELAKGAGAGAKLFALLEREPLIRSADGDIHRGLKGNLEFTDLKFYYPTRPEVTVMRSFNLTVKAGTTVALVGASGSGKSTVISLLEGFYLPSAGTIKADGVDISTFDPVWWRSQIAYVGQEPVLFSGTIRENIVYGRPNATDKEVERAAQIANAHEFIMEQPQQYATRIGQRGITLSGGQKQRVAIARAALMNPLILLLDEATSALDTESEAKVQQALERLMKDRTALVVAHRLSTIRNADCIVVMRKGEVMEKGTHDELVHHGGVYAQLISKQLDANHVDSAIEELDQRIKSQGVNAMDANGGLGTKIAAADITTPGLDGVTEFTFPGDAKTAPLTPIDWSTVLGVEMSKSSSPREGFHVALGIGRRAITVKASGGTLASEMFATGLAQMVRVRVPRLRAMSAEDERTACVAALKAADLRQGGQGRSRTSRFAMRKLLLVSEYVCGGRMRSLRYAEPTDIRALFKPSADAPLSEEGKGRLRNLGSALCLNLLLNNLDCIPLGDVWSNPGNPKNVLFELGTGALFVVDVLEIPIVHAALADKYCARVTAALREVNALSDDAVAVPPSLRRTLDFLVESNMYDVGISGALAIRDGIRETARALVALPAASLETLRATVIQQTNDDKTGIQNIDLTFLQKTLSAIRAGLDL